MKSLIKKLAAVLIAVATTLGFAGLGALTASAAGDRSITVNTVVGFAGELKLYKMFSAANVSPTQDKDGNLSIDYTLEDKWKPFFTSGEAGTTIANDTNLSANAAKYIRGLNDTQLADFARKAVIWAETNKIDVDKQSGTIATDARAYTFTDLGLGYYLIAPDKKQQTVDGTYNPLLVNVTDEKNDVSIQLKHEYPTIDKTVDEKPATDKNIGDTVEYTLKSTVAANMADYTEGYVFTFHDTLSKGLDLVPNAADDSVTDVQQFTPTVKIIGAGTNGADVPLTKGTDFTVSVTENKDDKDNPDLKTSTTIKVILTDLKNKHSEAAGKEITVTYSAKINANAVSGSTGNKNSAQIEYSNDPSSNQTGKSVPSEVEVHTFEFTIDKYTGRIYNESSERLAGAKFKVYRESDTTDLNKSTFDETKDTLLKFSQTQTGSGSAELKVKYAEKQDADGLSEMTTPASGRINVSGLAAGVYWVKETAAPKGYNQLKNAIKVVIDATYDTDTDGNVTGTHTGKLTGWKITYTLDGNTKDGTGEHPVLPVENKNGLVLPSTGGWGTMLFTVIGVLVVALGTVWYVKSGRKDSAK
ncbi:SpaH/EbpB family LPXTG-anchored major pilin [Bifidobacterium amazonense]|uniref:SpaH/EbpB family LPXTG-anchored major pilin n=1 Tax=Bifidobacterium amazonense TaxID=2809027 RepID=A0ABS9VX29_9BIFI|nr:SpaH/EbpB family LPXTG-anchored major pilin [Bifidobacterium amazonense]MCH9276661.1 SpaH/EbpB family LPXTG-anchored major pilin [Bifidobacterium amazonense]